MTFAFLAFTRTGKRPRKPDCRGASSAVAKYGVVDITVAHLEPGTVRGSVNKSSFGEVVSLMSVITVCEYSKLRSKFICSSRVQRLFF